jgi:hypothetical protein
MLVSPPLLLQTRTVRTDQCAYKLGTEYNAKVWDTAANSTCSPPYLCTEEIIEDATALMARDYPKLNCDCFRGTCL